MNDQQASVPGRLLDQAPCGMALLDPQGRVSWANAALANMLGMQPGSLAGQAADKLPEPANRVLLADQQLLQLHDASGERWLQRETHAADAESLLIVQDITEQQRLDSENRHLRQQVEDLKLNDDLTGLPNKRAITQALELQISRSRRYQNPLSVVMVHIALQDDQVELLSNGADPLVLGVSRFLRDRLRWVDQIGRWEENIFILVLPETSKADADGLVEKIQAEQDTLHLPPPLENTRPILSFGSGYWQKGDDMRTLLRQVSNDLAGD